MHEQGRGFAACWKDWADYRRIERNRPRRGGAAAAEGANVVLVARTATDLAAAKAAIAEQSKVQIDTVVANLSHSSAVERLARTPEEAEAGGWRRTGSASAIKAFKRGKIGLSAKFR